MGSFQLTGKEEDAKKKETDVSEQNMVGLVTMYMAILTFRRE